MDRSRRLRRTPTPSERQDMTALPIQDEPLIAMLAGGILRDLDYPVFEARAKGEPYCSRQCPVPSEKRPNP